jgi:hypothetical protein
MRTPQAPSENTARAACDKVITYYAPAGPQEGEAWPTPLAAHPDHGITAGPLRSAVGLGA